MPTCEKIILVQTKEERKTKAKERLSKPEVKAKRNAYNKEYSSRPENIAKAQARKSTPEAKAKAKELSARPENKANLKQRRDDKRLKVLQYYSKSLSNSDIPCCNCCGENYHIDFLAVDHILGKKEMDLMKEFVEIGYSSKLKDIRLSNWIINNNFPKCFQILCHNCNSAKGYYGNCPLEGKPH